MNFPHPPTVAPFAHGYSQSYTTASGKTRHCRIDVYACPVCFKTARRAANTMRGRRLVCDGKRLVALPREAAIAATE